MRRRTSSSKTGFSAVTICVLLVVLGVVGFIGWQIFQTQQAKGPRASGGLVPVAGPTPTPSSNQQPSSAPDGVPDGYKAYTNSSLGFSFVYPESWGELQPVANPSAALSLSTPAVQRYSLADALQVQAFKKDIFRVAVNDKGVIVAPSPSGAGYEWKVTDKGQDKAPVGRPYTPQPSVAIRSGKATVYNFLNSQGACTYTSWAFAAHDNFIRLRLPSFCISPKPDDSEVQAGHKTDFENVKSTILRSITVL